MTKKPMVRSNLLDENNDFYKIFSLLIDAKKIIIFFTLLFALLASLVSYITPASYNSNYILKLGQPSSNNQFHRILIENLDTIIRELKIHFQYEKFEAVNFLVLENRLIEIRINNHLNGKSTILINKINEFISEKSKEIISNSFDYQRNALLQEKTYLLESIDFDEQLLTDEINNINKEISDKKTSKEIAVEILTNEIKYFEKKLDAVATSYPEQTDSNISSNQILENQQKQIVLEIEIRNKLRSLNAERSKLVNSQLSVADYFIKSQKLKLFELNQKLTSLNNQISTLDNDMSKFMDSKIIKQISSSKRDTVIKPHFLIFLGSSLGFFISIFIIFGVEYFKRLKKDHN